MAEPTATARAYAFTKDRILDGRYPGGDLISEGDVASAVNLSRTPVREAFLRLEGEGLMRLYPKRGALVVPVSAAEVENVMETRLLIERFAIEKTRPASPALLTDLESWLTRQEREAGEGAVKAFVESDRRFHRALVAAAGNDILVELHDSLRDRQSRMGLSAIARDEDRTRRILAEHRDLLDAIAAGDPVADEILERHLAGTLTVLRRAV